MKITRIEVRTVAPEVQRFTWSFDLPEQFMTNTVIRIETDTGVEGVAGVSNYTSYDFDRYTAETIRHLAPVLIGEGVDIGSDLRGRRVGAGAEDRRGRRCRGQFLFRSLGRFAEQAIDRFLDAVNEAGTAQHGGRDDK